jgi:hypothetical protein
VTGGNVLGQMLELKLAGIPLRKSFRAFLAVVIPVVDYFAKTLYLLSRDPRKGDRNYRKNTHLYLKFNDDQVDV